MLPIVTELRFNKPLQMLARPQWRDISPEIEPIARARKSACHMTVEVTVDGNVIDKNACVYAG
jgi:hypothetical protein